MCIVYKYARTLTNSPAHRRSRSLAESSRPPSMVSRFTCVASVTSGILFTQPYSNTSHWNKRENTQIRIGGGARFFAPRLLLLLRKKTRKRRKWKNSRKESAFRQGGKFYSKNLRVSPRALSTILKKKKKRSYTKKYLLWLLSDISPDRKELLRKRTTWDDVNLSIHLVRSESNVDKNLIFHRTFLIFRILTRAFNRETTRRDATRWSSFLKVIISLSSTLASRIR